MNDHPKKQTNRWWYAISIGFFAGFFWGGMHVIFYYLGFTKVLPAFWVEPFFKHSFMNSWSGHLSGWVVFMFISILAALLYVGVLYKLRGAWPGMMYGAAWWAVIFLWFGPFAGMVKRIDRLDLNSTLTEACLFVLWGVFIGYSTSLEFTDERKREPESN